MLFVAGRALHLACTGSIPQYKSQGPYSLWQFEEGNCWDFIKRTYKHTWKQCLLLCQQKGFIHRMVFLKIKVILETPNGAAHWCLCPLPQRCNCRNCRCNCRRCRWRSGHWSSPGPRALWRALWFAILQVSNNSRIARWRARTQWGFNNKKNAIMCKRPCGLWHQSRWTCRSSNKNRSCNRHFWSVWSCSPHRSLSRPLWASRCGLRGEW